MSERESFAQALRGEPITLSDSAEASALPTSTRSMTRPWSHPTLGPVLGGGMLVLTQSRLLWGRTRGNWLAEFFSVDINPLERGAMVDLSLEEITEVRAEGRFDSVLNIRAAEEWYRFKLGLRWWWNIASHRKAKKWEAAIREAQAALQAGETEAAEES